MRSVAFFLGGVIDIGEAFRAIELTHKSLIAPHSAPLDGLRTIDKICYNLLDKQIPAHVSDPATSRSMSLEFSTIVTESFIVFQAYIELERRARPGNLQAMIQALLKEPNSEQFLKLEIPWSAVYFVDTPDSYLDAVEYLKKCKLIGFDSEWKPVVGGQGRMALLQVASLEKVILFDILRLSILLTQDDWMSLKSVFTDTNVIKLGFATRDDSKLLKEIMGPVDMAPVKDLALIMRALEKLRPDKMLPKGHVFPVVRGLSRLCNILLGKPLNKSKKLSMTNWEKRPLARLFLEYAALDAHCLVLCWKELENRLGPNAEDLIEISVLAYNAETEALKSAYMINTF